MGNPLTAEVSITGPIDEMGRDSPKGKYMRLTVWGTNEPKRRFKITHEQASLLVDQIKFYKVNT